MLGNILKKRNCKRRKCLSDIYEVMEKVLSIGNSIEVQIRV